MLDELFEPENREKLVTLLAYHVAAGSFDMKQSQVEKNLNMVRGGKLRVSSDSGNTRVNDAVIIESDIRCSDGIIHAIDTVLIPESIQ